MPVDNVSSALLYQSTIGYSVGVQDQIVKIDQQLSSGAKSQDFKGLNGQVDAYVSMQNDLTAAATYTTVNSQVSARLNTTSQALGQMITIAGNAKNLMLQARNTSTSASLAFDQQMMGYFQQIAGQFNGVDGNGNSLFGGTQTDRPPIDPTVYPSNTVTGTPDANYYKGNSGTITATIADNQNITTNVPGNDQGFQQIFAAFDMAKKAFDSGDNTMMGNAEAMMQSGVARITTVQTTIDANAAQVQQEQSISDAHTTYLKGLNINGADIVALSTQLATYQGILQASFQAFASLQKLGLSQYLA